MNYELSGLERLIDEILTGTTDAEFTLNDELQRASMSIRLGLINCGSDSGFTYLRQHQYGLLEVYKKVENHIAQVNAEHKQSPYREIFTILFVLLTELQERYSDYFDVQSPIPCYLLQQRLFDLSMQWSLLSSELGAAGLPESFIRSLEKFIIPQDSGAKQISFRKQSYLEALVDTFSARMRNEPMQEIFEVMLFMISAKFNHPGFYNYCYGFLQQQKSRVQNMDGQLELFHYLKKCIVQIVPLTLGPYQPALPPLHESMLRLVEAEITYLKDLGAMSEEVGLFSKHFKVNLTVKQLAIFINLQSACGIIVADRPKAIHEYVTSHYSTMDAESISEKSFKNAYYGNAANDLDKVLEKLTEMLVIAQRKY